MYTGNLSQERVSKRDVFELFHRHGRLAQISLKSAYGFVQYHTVADAQSAMDVLQGAEVKGRKISTSTCERGKKKQMERAIRLTPTRPRDLTNAKDEKGPRPVPGSTERRGPRRTERRSIRWTRRSAPRGCPSRTVALAPTR